jgi:glycosyltransferase involved in cell wall biosynthesis
MSSRGGVVTISVDGEARCSARDGALSSGYCFVGVRGGRARLRDLRVCAPGPDERHVARLPPPRYTVLRASVLETAPLLSIVTTVYDRVACLEQCLRSVDALTFRDFEHIVVADRPPASDLKKIEGVVDRHARPGRSLAVLAARHNNWGIAPAAAGLAMATGKYVAFLSDDNGYMPGHFEPLVDILERQPEVGFAYSSCLYGARAVLRQAPPRYGRVDLGQPTFRKEVLDVHLDGTLPFHEGAWDWRLIERLMKRGVAWKHVDRATFVFRLQKYPDLVAAMP